MTNTASIERCPNCALLLLRPKDAIEPRTARVEELLCQNYPPLDVELSAFRKVAQDTRSALEDLDLKIVQTRELLEHLLSARQQAQSRLEDAKSILHPMRSIPNELLAEIFGHCTLKGYDDEAADSLDPQAAPWLLTRISCRWRELAVNLPQLWTYLLLDFDKHAGFITGRQCVYKVGLFIQRSRGLPMEVYLGSMKSVAAHPVIPALEVSIPQWRYLEADLPRASLQSLSGNSFLSLRRLRLWLPSDAPDLDVDVFQPMRAPVLHDFELLTDESWQALEHVRFPWSHLTSVAFFPAFDVEALNYLRTMAELKELDVLATSATRTPIHDVISLPKVRRLTITEGNNAAGRSKEFFSALAIPALSELTVAYHAKSVLHFPTSPLPLGNLTKLDIWGGMNSHEENTQSLLDFLTLTHHVESLRLSDNAMTVEFVDGLNLVKLADGSPVRLPCLRFLDIGECEVAPSLADDIDPLFEMLYSRLPTAVVAEGRKGGEQTVKATTSCNAGRDGSGQNAPSNQTGTEFAPRSSSDSDNHRRCLKTVRLSRWLYVDTRRKWPEDFLELKSRAALECGVTMTDIDPDLEDLPCI